jgi:hypothetical protein
MAARCAPSLPLKILLVVVKRKPGSFKSVWTVWSLLPGLGPGAPRGTCNDVGLSTTDGSNLLTGID